MSVARWARDPNRAAGGRRRYNNLRKVNAELRRVRVAELLLQYGLNWGAGAEIARTLGVSPSTVSRDLKALKEAGLI
jgi:DNA-binding transcriptional ArsR family regulator